MFDYSNIKLQELALTWLPAGMRVAMLRLDLLHPEVSGNKWFKLRYNLEAAQAAGQRTILTFGGAYSNHIAATAAACRLFGLQSIGIIRGEASSTPSPTLIKAAADGMQLHFVSREEYRLKPVPSWASDAYVIPEGGHNILGVKGCEEILSLTSERFTHVCCAVGTGTTLAGLINSADATQQITGYVVLKGAAYLSNEIQQLLKPEVTTSWRLAHEFHGGGYAKTTPALLEFIKEFEQAPLDRVYTAKMLMGFKQEVLTGVFPPGSQVLLIHTGGLQGEPIKHA
jgi:1-aminocyclopropane-1-carboxylate deaminase